MPEPPFVLQLADGRSSYVTLMAVLFALFVLRVVGQILAATIAPAWLPPMTRWYSGLMPYRYLLPAQILFIVVMIAMMMGVAGGASALGPRAGQWIVWASYVYALGMVVRSIRYATASPEKRGVLIPIIFHFVLATFLFVYGSAAIVLPEGAAGGGVDGRRRTDGEPSRYSAELPSVVVGGWWDRRGRWRFRANTCSPDARRA